MAILISTIKCVGTRLRPGTIINAGVDIPNYPVAPAGLTPSKERRFAFEGVFDRPFLCQQPYPGALLILSDVYFTGQILIYQNEAGDPIITLSKLSNLSRDTESLEMFLQKDMILRWLDVSDALHLALTEKGVTSPGLVLSLLGDTEQPAVLSWNVAEATELRGMWQTCSPSSGQFVAPADGCASFLWIDATNAPFHVDLEGLLLSSGVTISDRQRQKIIAKGGDSMLTDVEGVSIEWTPGVEEGSLDVACVAHGSYSIVGHRVSGSLGVVTHVDAAIGLDGPIIPSEAAWGQGGTSILVRMGVQANIHSSWHNDLGQLILEQAPSSSIALPVIFSTTFGEVHEIVDDREMVYKTMATKTRVIYEGTEEEKSVKVPDVNVSQMLTVYGDDVEFEISVHRASDGTNSIHRISPDHMHANLGDMLSDADADLVDVFGSDFVSASLVIYVPIEGLTISGRDGYHELVASHWVIYCSLI